METLLYCFPNFFKYENESSIVRKFLEHSLLRSESSRGTKVPWNESSWTFRSPEANVLRIKTTGAKVLSVDFSLPGTKVQRNEMSGYQNYNGGISVSRVP